MSRVCAITGKRPKVGGRIIHKGVSKKAGGIGLQLVKNNKRTFRPNLQLSASNYPAGKSNAFGYLSRQSKREKFKKPSFLLFALPDWALMQ